MTEHEATARPTDEDLMNHCFRPMELEYLNGKGHAGYRPCDQNRFMHSANPRWEGDTKNITHNFISGHVVNAHDTMLAALKIAFNADMQDGDLRSSKTYYWSDKTEPMTASEVVAAAIAAGEGVN